MSLEIEFISPTPAVDAVVVVRPGDIVILRPSEGSLTRAAAEQIRKQLTPLSQQHGISFAVVDAALDLTVLRRGDAE